VRRFLWRKCCVVDFDEAFLVEEVIVGIQPVTLVGVEQILF
jgi:hypothetical protein